MKQQTLFNDTDSTLANDKTTTFVDNMKLPLHRWFKYSAGFSANWVKEIIKQFYRKDFFILDPFTGSGTTNVVANELGVHSLGYEQHPFVRKIATIKASCYDANLEEFSAIINKALKNPPSTVEYVPTLLQKCYSTDNLSELLTLRNFYYNFHQDTIEWRLFWLAITSILRVTSHAGTAQWQYILPKKSKKKVLSPREALQKKSEEIIKDIKLACCQNTHSLGTIVKHDARKENSLIQDAVDMVITSPPYPNNYDYADATRLEMVFWQEITGYSDLQNKVRNNLVRSCSQHSAADKIALDTILAEPVLEPIIDELQLVCKTLEKLRLEHGGKKTYHTMLASYYYDMANVFMALRKAMKRNSLMCFVIGDSAPYGVYAPADVWLSKLALSAGFCSSSFEKTRDRNVKWKNRKHTVPLKEGRLWIKG